MFPLVAALVLFPLFLLKAAVPDLSKIRAREDFDALLAATSDPDVKKVLAEHADAILAAAGRHPHVESVLRTIESAPGQYTKSNRTPEALRKAAGGDLAIFDTLTHVSTSILNGRPHVYRGSDEDPYDATFIEHLGNIPELESVNLVATKIQDSWLAPLLKLQNLKSFSMEGRAVGLPGKPALGDPSLVRLQQLARLESLTFLELAYFANATDDGLALLAGFKNLEGFTFRGSPVKGHAFAKFEGWTQLKRIRFHSNTLDDEGLGYVCARFPNLESLNLINSQGITDASAPQFLKLPKLKRLLINGPKITAAILKNVGRLPLEELLVAQGAINPPSDAIASLQTVSTLRRLSIEGPPLTDAHLGALAGLTQLQELSFEALPLPENRLQQLRAFAFLKKLTLALRPKGYPQEIQAAVRTLLPHVDVRFVQ